MSMKFLLVSGLLSCGGSIAQADECTELGMAVGREVIKTYGSLNTISLSTFDFCKYDFSKASSDEQASVEASYKVLTGKVAKSSQEVQEKQSQECRGSYGLEQLSHQTSGDAYTWSAHGRDVMQACFDNEAVRITSAKYAGRTVEFRVKNGTGHRVPLRGNVVNPRGMATCDITNQESGLFGGIYIDVHKAVTVTCTLNGRKELGTDKSQVTYGGGFITLDIPGSTVRGLPVPEMRTPLVGEAQRILSAELEAAKIEVKNLRNQLAELSLKLKAAEELTAKVRNAMTEGQALAIQRLHVVTLGWQPAVPNSQRFHRLEDNGVSCVGNWGPAAIEFADRVCGKDNYAWDSVSNLHGGPCGYNANAFLCKVPVP